MTVTSLEQRPAQLFNGPHPVRSVLAQMALWHLRASLRRDLRRLAMVGDHMLRDVGLTRDEVAREVAKPFWRA